MPQFPRATIVVQSREWEDAYDNRSTMRRSYRRDNLDPIADQVRLASGVAPHVAGLAGVRVLPAPGHTWGQQAVLFEDEHGLVCFPGDVMPTASHVGLAFSMAYDMEPFTNLRTKASILDQLGRTSEAESLRAKGLNLATEAEVNALGYQMLGQNRVEEALEMFRMNVIRYPNSWNAYDSLAEGLERAGDIEGAIINYRQALSLVNSAAQKQRIQETLTRLRGE